MLQPLPFLLCYFSTLAVSTLGHSLEVTYNTSGYCPSGRPSRNCTTFAIGFDGYSVISEAHPAVAGLLIANTSRGPGPSPPFDYNWQFAANRSFEPSTSTFFSQHYWGNVTVRHSRPSPLALRMDMSVTNTLNYAITYLRYQLAGDYEVSNASAFAPPAPIRDWLFPCSGCWVGCGNLVQCTGEYVQAIPMDWGSGSATFCVEAQGTSTPAGHPAPCTLQIYFQEGSHLIAMVGSPAPPYGPSPLLPPFVLQPGQTVSASYALRFGDGSGSGEVWDPAGPLAPAADVFSAFAQARPQTTPPPPGGRGWRSVWQQLRRQLLLLHPLPQRLPQPPGVE